MTVTIKPRVVLAAGIIGFLALGSERLPLPVPVELISTAEARVGRPLTPVSVAGVARRTVRRCAVGVYNC
jgi:hypothetical protein